MKKKIIISSIILLLSLSVFAQGVKEEKSPYVASTSWSAAYAYVGGLDNVITIAPADLTHPPEYEILPSDILTIQNSEAFVYAGYESMMKTLTNNLIKENIKIQITTVNSLDNIKVQANKISTKYNTQEKSNFRVQKIEDLFVTTREIIKEKKLNKLPSYVHFHQVALAKSLGLNIVGTFGPNSITPENIQEVSKLNNAIIIDNIHNQLAAPFKEVNSNSKVIVWRNFPNKTGNDELFNMIQNNIDALLSEF